MNEFMSLLSVEVLYIILWFYICILNILPLFWWNISKKVDILLFMFVYFFAVPLQMRNMPCGASVDEQTRLSKKQKPVI